ncbi:hypothetical protein ACEPPN_014543 [Leptodophora sp. 'Broadleaf-Isolate-01']
MAIVVRDRTTALWVHLPLLLHLHLLKIRQIAVARVRIVSPDFVAPNGVTVVRGLSIVDDGVSLVVWTGATASKGGTIFDLK